MKISVFLKNVRFKIFKYLLKKCFKPELKEIIMRKYYVSYIIINNSNQGLPIYGDTFIDIDGKITNTAIKNIKKQIIDTYLQYTPKIPGLNQNISVVLTCIHDITKEEISNAIDNNMDKLDNKSSTKFDEQYILPGTVEIINGKKYVGGKEVVE